MNIHPPLQLAQSSYGQPVALIRQSKVAFIFSTFYALFVISNRIDLNLPNESILSF